MPTFPYLDGKIKKFITYAKTRQKAAALESRRAPKQTGRLKTKSDKKLIS